MLEECRGRPDDCDSRTGPRKCHSHNLAACILENEDRKLLRSEKLFQLGKYLPELGSGSVEDVGIGKPSWQGACEPDESKHGQLVFANLADDLEDLIGVLELVDGNFLAAKLEALDFYHF